ncbi:alpha/beta fold hydrolase [Aquimarina algiphila]|uniref:alpha/beta fold hydrolase n=1 Tax=Aquimarina algiphila TaxID=2047982 RepID=UPI00232FDD72|nr:alpha/beta hydrolase [Aquimarina algiphila]
MKIKSKSIFRNPINNKIQFENWVRKLENSNGRKYERKEIETSLGSTIVWSLNSSEPTFETLVIFPGARTTSLIWDLDKGLDNFNHKIKILMVETNGLPNLSDGNTPDIKTLDYGIWATEVLNKLDIEKVFIAGASFGGLISMKLAIIAPERIKAVFLLNPGCLQPFSLTIKNLYYNLLPILRTNENNVIKFLDKIVFSSPNHKLSDSVKKILIEYQMFALSNHIDKAQKPYYMGKELSKTNVSVYLLEGDKDFLFPFRKSINNAKKHIKSLKGIKVFNNVGHGIETYAKAIKYIGEKIKDYQETIK